MIVFAEATIQYLGQLLVMLLMTQVSVLVVHDVGKKFLAKQCSAGGSEIVSGITLIQESQRLQVCEDSLVKFSQLH